jgi:SAM-dependent methyltransferase
MVQLQKYYDTYWTKNPASYSGEGQRYATNFRNWMLENVNGISLEANILEVGCGDASFTKCLAEFSSAVTAIDISAKQIERNAKAYPEIKFMQHDVAERFPFEDGTFDVIWCSEVLEHLFDPRFALREMCRVIKPGGRLLVTVPYHGLLKNVLIALFNWDEHFAPNNPHIRFFSRKTLSRLTATAGFREIQTRCCGLNKPLRDLFIATNILLKARK